MSSGDSSCLPRLRHVLSKASSCMLPGSRQVMSKTVPVPSRRRRREGEGRRGGGATSRVAPRRDLSCGAVCSRASSYLPTQGPYLPGTSSVSEFSDGVVAVSSSHEDECPTS